MDNVAPGQLLVPLDDLLHDDQNLGLGQPLLLPALQVFLQIAVAAVLHYDVEAAFAVEHLHQLHDVRVLEFAQNPDLFVNGPLQVRVFLYGLEVHLFHCHLLLARVLEALEDLAEGTLTQALLGVVAVLSYRLYRPFLHFNVYINYNKLAYFKSRSMNDKSNKIFSLFLLHQLLKHLKRQVITDDGNLSLTFDGHPAG